MADGALLPSRVSMHAWQAALHRSSFRCYTVAAEKGTTPRRSCLRRHLIANTLPSPPTPTKPRRTALAIPPAHTPRPPSRPVLARQSHAQPALAFPALDRPTHNPTMSSGSSSSSPLEPAPGSLAALVSPPCSSSSLECTALLLTHADIACTPG